MATPLFRLRVVESGVFLCMKLYVAFFTFDGEDEQAYAIFSSSEKREAYINRYEAEGEKKDSLLCVNRGIYDLDHEYMD